MGQSDIVDTFMKHKKQILDSFSRIDLIHWNWFNVDNKH